MKINSNNLPETAEYLANPETLPLTQGGGIRKHSLGGTRQQKARSLRMGPVQPRLARTARAVSPLPADAQRTYTSKPLIPGTLALGTYYIGAIADTGNRVGESNENNNALAGNQVSVLSRVDLVITSVSGPATASLGQQIGFTATVKNQGSANAGQFYVTVYLSTDSTITKADLEMSSGFVSGLAPGAQKTLTINSTIPASVAPGPYTIGAIADSRNTVAESNENNNSLAGAPMTVAR